MDFELSRALLDLIRSLPLRHELDRQLGDFCHQCRNRLNSLKLSIYLAKRQSSNRLNGAWKLLEADYQTLEDQIDRVHKICRPPALARLVLDLDLLIDDRRPTWARLLCWPGRHIDFRREGTERKASYDVDQLGAALDSFVTWRAEQGGELNNVSIRWWVDETNAHISWHETGPLNLGQQASSVSKYSTWSLPLLVGVVGAHGGQLEIDETSGWKLSLCWPKS